MIFQIVKETGWTYHQVLWKVSRANIMMMLADRSEFKEAKDVVVESTGKELQKRRKKQKRE